jgi:hypothetical protein
MKRLIGSIFILLSIAATVLIALVIYSETSAWQLISETPSPNSKYEAQVFKYISDIDRHAPYGDYVIIQPSSLRIAWKNDHVALAAYCKNGASINWNTNTNLDIFCEIDNKKDIRTLTTKAFGIDIQLINK